MTTRTEKAQANFRLTETARTILAELAQRKGVSTSAALELLLRDEARREGITTSTSAK